MKDRHRGVGEPGPPPPHDPEHIAKQRAGPAFSLIAKGREIGSSTEICKLLLALQSPRLTASPQSKTSLQETRWLLRAVVLFE